MPACASPAIASPAMTATATGRNSGSTIARAATANSEPLASTADRNAGPCPGRGPTCVIATRSPRSSAARPAARSSATSGGGGTACAVRPRSRRVHPIRARAASRRARPARACAARPRARSPGRRRRPAARSGSPGRSPRTTRRSPSRSSTRPSSRAAAATPRLASDDRAPGRAAQLARSSCTTSRPRSSTPTRVHICSTSASRWLDRNTVVPAACSCRISSRISRMPCGSRPFVGSSRTSNSGLGKQRGRKAEPLPHAQRDTPSPAAGPRPPSPTVAERLVDARAASLRRPAGASRSRRTSIRFARAGQMPVRRRRPRPAPRPGAAPAAPPSASARPNSSISPDVASTRPRINRTVVVLPEPFAPRKP